TYVVWPIHIAKGQGAREIDRYAVVAMSVNHRASAAVTRQLPQLGKIACSEDDRIAAPLSENGVADAAIRLFKGRNHPVDDLMVDQRLVADQKHRAVASVRQGRHSGQHRRALAFTIRG